MIIIHNVTAPVNITIDLFREHYKIGNIASRKEEEIKQTSKK